MLVDSSALLTTAKEPALTNLLSALNHSTRDTDLKGWFKSGAVIGVIFTELGGGKKESILHAISTKVTAALHKYLADRQHKEIKLSFHLFPEDRNDHQDGIAKGDTPVFWADLAKADQNTAALRVKRLIDLVGSIAALIACLPLFFVIAIAIKVTSRGPILFRQVRVGQFGTKFTFLKFRSMYVDSDQSIHEEYTKHFIAGATDNHGASTDQQTMYKLAADPRVTPVGRLLRKTSLDELPQFLHVLKGQMSLVGPRPPIPYEYERYALWHKQRLLAAKPGLTGLWQVQGRSRVKFDDMVRIDIRYARTWSLSLDLKILLQTPRAIVLGEGAY
jgi:lipopolysaccharide/colanic/teichoic acid biosynthesis glycosyltransferase